SIGGSASESISSWVLPTPDGGFITRMASNSPPGTGNLDSFCSPVERRMIFTKFNSDASVAEWSKCFGTEGDSNFLFLYPQPDGTDILIGDFKASGALIKKYDATGGEVWQKNYSKGMAVKLHSTLPTTDGGYLLLCTSHYIDTNVQVHYGTWETQDFWLVKLDSSGNKVWSKVIGGTEDEDRGVLVPGLSGDYYIVGKSASTDLDCVGNHGRADVFVAHCNDTGGIIWRRMYGGSESERNVSACPNGTGGLVIACYTLSADGDVHHFIGGEDYWLLEVDTSGTILWENCYGTTGYENVTSVCRATDGTIWMNGSVKTATTNEDVYIVHTSATGTLLQSKILQSKDLDRGDMIYPLPGGFVLAGGFSVNLDGDFAAIPYRGAWDVFLAVFGPSDAGVDGMDAAAQRSYNIFPNPAYTELTIETNLTHVAYQVTVTDIVGRVVLRCTIPKGSAHASINTASISQGIYTVSILSETGPACNKLFQINR
ncbi:MAG: T9SS type A sorting domain-containing protein, partial [Chitinophagaceae bacterium]|nr:T9SS type A sorting domain-containing protein [Chitinophagaceae bacterium]